MTRWEVKWEQRQIMELGDGENNIRKLSIICTVRNMLTGPNKWGPINIRQSPTSYSYSFFINYYFAYPSFSYLPFSTPNYVLLFPTTISVLITVTQTNLKCLSCKFIQVIYCTYVMLFYVLYCTVIVLTCFVMCGCVWCVCVCVWVCNVWVCVWVCNVWVCVYVWVCVCVCGFVMCGCFGNLYLLCFVLFVLCFLLFHLCIFILIGLSLLV